MTSDPVSLPPGIERAVRLPGGGQIRHAAWSPRGDSLVAARVDGGVRLWTGLPDQLRLAKALPAPRDFRALDTPASQVAWSPAGRSIAAVSWDGKRMAVWDVESTTRRSVIDVDAEELVCAAWAGEERLNAAVVTGTRPHQRLAIRGYDAASGRQIDECLDEPRDSALTGTSSDGRLLAVAGGNEVQVWDVGQARVVARVPAQPRSLHGVALRPDVGTLALSVNQGEILAWDVREAKPPAVMYDHARPAYSVVFSDDGRLLASRSADATVRLWRCDTWECVAVIEEASNDPVELSFRPGALTLTSFESTNTALRIWDIDYEELLRGPAMINILMLTADPCDAGRLRLDEEAREIQEQLQLAGLRSRFAFHLRPSVRSKDFSLGLLQVRPRIVHFSGHGGSDGSIWLEDAAGFRHPVAPDNLAMLIEQVSDHVECVVLNACYSQQQADAISRSIDYVIGTRREIEDRAAIAFSVGFYQALGAGRSIDEAFAFGRAQIGMQCGAEHVSTPVLTRRSAASVT